MNQAVSRSSQSNISSSDDSSPSTRDIKRSSVRQQTAKDQVEDASFKDTNILSIFSRSAFIGSIV